MTDLGFHILTPTLLRALLERVEAGEPAAEVYAEFVFADEQVDNDADES